MDAATTWLIRRCPWRVLEWATERYGWCWATVVMIKMGHKEYDSYFGTGLKPDPSCWTANAGDYCGRFKTWEEFHAAEGEPVYLQFVGPDEEDKP